MIVMNGGRSMFCSKCGNQISENVKFCSKCGCKVNGSVSNVYTDTVSNTVQYQIPVRLVLCTNRKLGMVKQSLCYVIFYDDRIILTHMSNAKMKEIGKEFAKRQKEEKTGFIGRLVEGANFYNDYAETFKDKSPEENIAGNPLNVEIPMNQINKVMFKCAGYIHREDEVRNMPGDMHIVTTSEKYKFTHKYYDNDKSIKEELNAIVGRVLKYK